MLDEVIITLANPGTTPFYITAGHTVSPFGRCETLMLSDPFTLDLGETKETPVLVGVETEGLLSMARRHE